MKTKTHRSKAERLGRWLGGMWRAYARRERQTVGWLVARGVPAGAAKALLWGVKLAALALLLYGAFWLALLLVFAVAAAWTAEQRLPQDGFELKFPATLDELRETPGYDPNLHNDTSHEMYQDDDQTG